MLASVSGLTDFVKGRVTSFCESSSIFAPSGGKWRWKNGLAMGTRMKTIAAVARGFLRAKRGNVAMMFGLALVPLVLAAGAGLDYSRAMLVRQQMGEALDAAALAVGSTTGLNATTAQALAQKYFDANYTIDKTDFGSPTIQPLTYNANGSVTITANNTMNTILMNLVGVPNIPVSTTSTVVWGQSKLWVSLVLDNTGSMTQTDGTGTSKISALQTASHQLLTILQNAAATAGDVQVSIVTFAKLVNVGKGNVSASWIDWTDWKAAPPNPSSGAIPTTTGPGDNCPWSNGSDGFTCFDAPAPNTTTTTSKIPSSGTYSGYICPSQVQTYTSSGSLAGMGGHYFNGCYTSVATGTQTTVGSGSGATCNGYHNCSCTGSKSSKVCKALNYTHTWTTNATSTWGGCIMDRTQSYDVQNTAPSGASLFPAANDDNCPVTSVMTLGYNWTNLSTQIDAMTAKGSTNQPIGLAHGWQTITTGSPYGAPSLPANTSQYIILVSDGLNTQDRWYGDGFNQSSSIDTREGLACTNAKAAGITIYTIFVDLGGTQGSSAALQSCATDSSKYFDLTTSGSIITTFNTIAQQITNVRVVH
jgi:Flp pilus assembly protein TadG